MRQRQLIRNINKQFNSVVLLLGGVVNSDGDTLFANLAFLYVQSSHCSLLKAVLYSMSLKLIQFSDEMANLTPAASTACTTCVGVLSLVI